MWSQKCRTADLVIIIYSKKCERTGFSVQLIYFNLAGSKLLARKWDSRRKRGQIGGPFDLKRNHSSSQHVLWIQCHGTWEKQMLWRTGQMILAEVFISAYEDQWISGWPMMQHNSYQNSCPIQILQLQSTTHSPPSCMLHSTIPIETRCSWMIDISQTCNLWNKQRILARGYICYLPLFGYRKNIYQKINIHIHRDFEIPSFFASWLMGEKP